MENKPFDRSVFIPIVIGIIAVMGICLVLFAMRLSASRANIQSVETNTPLKYKYLGTEPGVVTLMPQESPTVTISETPTRLTINLPSTFTPTIESNPVIPLIATNTLVSPSPTLALNVTYDDTDFKFNYTGNWIPSTVSGTYQNTLHISNTIGNSVQLSFVGQKIRITYQAGPSLGVIAIKLDGVDFTLDQSASETLISQWESPVLALASHSVTVTHISGGSINVDFIAVLDISTPTSTPTPTITP